MTRVSKQAERRAMSPRRPRKGSVKTGPRKDALPLGYKPQENAYQGNASIFIAKIK